MAVLARRLGLPVCISADSHGRIRAKHGFDYFDGVEVRLVGESDVMTRWHGEDVCFVVNEATSAGTGKRSYEGLCQVRENFLSNKQILAGIIRRDPKAAATVRYQMAIGQYHSTPVAEDVEAINRHIFA